jgi:hypothetical protein
MNEYFLRSGWLAFQSRYYSTLSGKSSRMRRFHAALAGGKYRDVFFVTSLSFCLSTPLIEPEQKTGMNLILHSPMSK